MYIYIIDSSLQFLILLKKALSILTIIGRGHMIENTSLLIYISGNINNISDKIR